MGGIMKNKLAVLAAGMAFLGLVSCKTTTAPGGTTGGATGGAGSEYNTNQGNQPTQPMLNEPLPDDTVPPGTTTPPNSGPQPYDGTLPPETTTQTPAPGR
jgi:hypothetical protein